MGKKGQPTRSKDRVAEAVTTFGNVRRPATSEDLRLFLNGKRFVLDCGHRFCLHNFSHTLVITTDGKCICHECAY